MKIGILGSGDVGVALAKGFIAEGHEVFIATREPDSAKAVELKNKLEGATVTNFVSAAKEAELAVLCVNSSGVEAVINSIGVGDLAGKTVIDTTNTMKPVNGIMEYSGGEVSIAEQIQTWLPESHVVKAFNSVGAATMYKPDFGDMKPTMFIAGENAEAKKQVSDIVELFGWEVLDTGGIKAARSLEPMVVIWVNNAMSGAGPHHAFKML